MLSAQAERRIMVCNDAADYMRASELNALEANDELDSDGHVAWTYDYEPDHLCAVDRLERVSVHRVHIP
jgi:hypothetical protein